VRACWPQARSLIIFLLVDVAIICQQKQRGLYSLMMLAPDGEAEGLFIFGDVGDRHGVLSHRKRFWKCAVFRQLALITHNICWTTDGYS
jgi:hypothetical protein